MAGVKGQLLWAQEIIMDLPKKKQGTETNSFEAFVPVNKVLLPRSRDIIKSQPGILYSVLKMEKT